jgi:hypothetical protein
LSRQFTVDGLLDYIKEYKNSEEGKGFSWIELARDFQKDIMNNRLYGKEKWWLSSDNKD